MLTYPRGVMQCSIICNSKYTFEQNKKTTSTRTLHAIFDHNEISMNAQDLKNTDTSFYNFN